MAGNSVKASGGGGGKGAKGSKGSKGGKGGKGGNKKRSGNMNKGGSSDMPAHKLKAQGGNKGKGKHRSKGKAGAPPPKGHRIGITGGSDAGYDSEDIDTEGLEEYAAHSTFLHDMDSDQLEGNKVLKADKKKRKRKEAAASATADDASQLSGGEEAGEEEEELEYERAPRKQRTWAAEEEQQVDALPVRGKDGKWTVPERPPAKETKKQARKDAVEQKRQEKQEQRQQRKQAAAEEGREEKPKEDNLVGEDEELQFESSEEDDSDDGGPSSGLQPELAELRDWENQQKSLAAAQAEIAKVCVSIIEDPDEKGYQLAELHDLYPSNLPHMASNPAYLSYQARVKKLVLLSQLAVYKDVVPGYRIRHVGEEQTLLSKEVREQRSREKALLAAYQKYLQRLDRETGLVSRTKISQRQLSVGIVAVECLCDLLKAVHHFNFSTNIVSTVVPLMDSRHSAVCNATQTAIEHVLKKATYSSAAVTAVRAIDQYAHKRQYKMRPLMLNCFLALQLTEDADETIRKQKNRERKRQQEIANKTSNRGKQKRGGHQMKTAAKAVDDAELERDMAEGEAVMTTEERRLAQAAMLRAMFLSYFRIIKSPKTAGPGVLKACLEGLGHFSHLISIDFLGDLFAALNELLRAGNVMPKTMDQIHFDAVYGHIVSSDENDDDEDDREFTLDVTESLTICHTALSLLTGPRGESLEIDPKTVADALYSLLPKLAKPAHTNLIPIALEALRFALLMRRQLSMARVAAFVKASLALAIHTPAPHASLALIGWVRQLIMRYPSVGSLLENSEQEGEEGGGKTDGRGSVVGLGLGPTAGAYNSAVEPDHANALTSSAWEITFLLSHWHPGVATSASGLVHDATKGKLGVTSAIISGAAGGAGVEQLWQTYDCDDLNGFMPAVATKPKGKPNHRAWITKGASDLAFDGAADEPLFSQWLVSSQADPMRSYREAIAM